MRIDLVDSPELVHGAARIIREDGTTRLSRMTEKLEEFYSYSEGSLVRAKCTSNIRIVFKSTTQTLSLKVNYGASCRALFRIDIVIDGQLYSEGPDEHQDSATIELANLAAHEKEIEIVLPHCSEAGVTSLDIDDGASLTPVAPHPKTWLAIGDSITQGMTASTPAKIFTYLTAKALSVNCHNIGVGGGKMEGALAEPAMELDWDIATVAFGTNDFNQGRTLDYVAENTERLLSVLTQNQDKTVALITTIPWADRKDPNKLGLHLDDYRNCMRNVAATFANVHLIEGEDLMRDDTSLFVDNVHPNDKGMAFYAENLTRELGRILQ